MRRTAFIALAFAAGCGGEPVPIPAPDDGAIVPTGVTRHYEITVTPGDYELKMDGGMVMGVVHGYLSDGHFGLPTLVADVGDDIEVTLHDQTDEMMGLHPHGVRYDRANEGMTRVAMPGEDITYLWHAVEGSGTFPYHSHELDQALVEYQGEAGVVGALVIRDPEEEARETPDFMITYLMMNTYLPWTDIDEVAMKKMMGPGESAEDHNHTMVVQEVRGDPPVTETKTALTAQAELGQTVRVNVIGFGDEFHTFHIHGNTWNDPQTGELTDVLRVGPATSDYFFLEDLDNPGIWMVHCHVDDHFHMMSTYLYVQ